MFRWLAIRIRERKVMPARWAIVCLTDRQHFRASNRYSSVNNREISPSCPSLLGVSSSRDRASKQHARSLRFSLLAFQFSVIRGNSHVFAVVANSRTMFRRTPATLLIGSVRSNCPPRKNRSKQQDREHKTRAIKFMKLFIVMNSFLLRISCRSSL